MSKQTKKLTVAIVGILFTVALAIYGSAHAMAKPKSQPSTDKKVDLVVHFVGDINPQLAIGAERSFAKETIVPFLEKRGYTSGSVYSMTDAILKNGRLERALINEMESDPEKDASRLIMVMVIATPGNIPGTIVTKLAILDNYTYDIVRARKLNVAPGLRTVWAYEDAPTELAPDDTAQALKQRIQKGLDTYDLQYQDKAKSGDYPDLMKLN